MGFNYFNNFSNLAVDILISGAILALKVVINTFRGMLLELHTASI